MGTGRLGRTRRIAATAGAVVVLGLGLAGCSTYAPADSVEAQIVSQLGAATADCPGDLDSTVGASITCAASGAGETFDVAVTVTSVDGDTINFDIERVGAPTAPTTPPDAPAAMQVVAGAVAGADVAAAVSGELAGLTGVTPDKINCPDLPAEVGSSIRCELVAGPDTFGMTVTATSVEDGEVLFDFAVDETG
jgi:hypothetical protein